MELLLQRYYQADDFTLGYLKNLNNNVLLCHTLEDAVRETKVYGETCIPDGVYHVGVRREGGLYKKFDKAYASLGHSGMLWIQDVPDFDWVYLHTGATVKDSSGCPLVGANSTGTLTNSRATYRIIYPLIHPYADAGSCWLTVKGVPNEPSR